jgi:hypothetical protein
VPARVLLPCLLMSTPHPTPYSVRKFLIFNKIEEGIRCKFLILLGLTRRILSAKELRFVFGVSAAFCTAFWYDSLCCHASPGAVSRDCGCSQFTGCATKLQFSANGRGMSGWPDGLGGIEVSHLRSFAFLTDGAATRTFEVWRGPRGPGGPQNSRPGGQRYSFPRPVRDPG